MTGSAILDLALLAMLGVYTVLGFRHGFVLSLGTFAGVIAGGVAAFFSIPILTAWVTDSQIRLPVILAVVVGLLTIGQSAGSAIGKIIRRRVDKTPLRVLDRIFGAAINLVAAAVIVSLLAFGLGSLGVPLVTKAIGASNVVSTIETFTPDPLKVLEARVRSMFVLDGLPRLIETISNGNPLPVPASGESAAQQLSARSVVKITGNAFKCGQNQSGSGFVVSPGRVITNAHVVAGVAEPMVLTTMGTAYVGRVVYFDPERDLAVIAVNGLPAPALRVDNDLATGDKAVFAGYPLGGPFRASPAAVQNVATITTADIYGNNPATRQVYYLAGDVQQGNSGGPLIDSTGGVTGVIFARSASKPQLGFAMTTHEFAPVAAKAKALSATVSSGSCTRD